MCGFAGFCDYSENLIPEKYSWMALARRMANRISHRGPDDKGEHVSAHCALAHVRLAVMDPEKGDQPMSKVINGHKYTIAYNGEIYNAAELRTELEALGHTFLTDCDTEVVLSAYIEYGTQCPQKLNGIFAFAVDDTLSMRTFLCRDRFGVKPLFYTLKNGRIAFASEIKALFEYPGITPIIGREGICEIFGLGPARTPGHGIFEGIHELPPAHFAIYNDSGLKMKPYFALHADEHTQSYEDTVAHVRELLVDTIERQLTADVPVCTFLSGGLDSSIVTAVASEYLKKHGKLVDTYSFEFKGNDEFFKPTAFQPDSDEYWAERVAEILGANHTTLLCDNGELVNSIFESTIAKDLPGMADIDGSLLHFCRLVKKKHTVALCGECADEIFGGYPWFHRPELYNSTAFPWSDNLDLRSSFLKPTILDKIDMGGYVNERLHETLSEVPHLKNKSAEEHRMREISYLNIKWFMTTLLDRKDRTSMYSGLEVRVPYADHRIIEYLYNVPWKFKCPGGVNKGLLRDAAKGFLPNEILWREKSPYPKTHNPAYEELLKKRLFYVLRDSTQPIHKLLSADTAEKLLKQSFDYGKPWFGQLMAGPQMIAYLLQVNYWFLHYNIHIDL